MAHRIWEQPIKIRSYQVDNESYLTIPALFSLMQEAAWEHVNLYDAGRSYLEPLNLFWALSKVYVKIYRLPKWNEKITLKTWGKSVQFLTHLRDFEFIDENGKLLIAATSNWIILDTTNFRPQKIAFQHAPHFTCENRNAIEEKVPKLKKIEWNSEKLHFHPVLYSDLDMNQHVNNAKYLQWLLDSPFYQFSSISKIKEIIINYISQAKLDDQYTVQTLSLNPTYHLSSLFGKKEGEEYCRVAIQW